MAIPERWRGHKELPPDVNQALERLVSLFKREGVMLAYLFGSLSQGQKADDVDLAILTQNEPVFRLREQICQCLRTERVDLVDLRAAPPVLRFEIIRTGRPVYAADKLIQERFELETLHLYRDTHFLRRRQGEHLRERFAQWSYE